MNALRLSFLSSEYAAGQLVRSRISELMVEELFLGMPAGFSATMRNKKALVLKDEGLCSSKLE